METQNSAYPYEVIHVPQSTHVRFELFTDLGSYVPPHWHRALEILYIQEGELEVTVESGLYLLKAGQCMLINSKVPHATKCLHGNKGLLMQIPISFIETYIPDINRLMFVYNCAAKNPLQPEKTERVKETLNRMMLINEIKPEGFLLRFNSLLFELLFQLYHNFRVEISKSALDKQTKNLSRLDPVIQYTADHYKQPISLEEIAETAALKPEYFCRFFKKNMGITYLEYLNEVRLSKIYQDLLNTDIPVVRLLEAHGFTNYKLFRRMFREHFKDTPSNIRKSSNT